MKKYSSMKVPEKAKVKGGEHNKTISSNLKKSVLDSISGYVTVPNLKAYILSTCIK